ncbi:hypothetical protein JR316_0013160 [Psilocybe cubensis]|uniref:Uncharacterized protein n=2 Tax=Psilocybe cubensis TaxID=181762 RepID=A0ACB8GI05_PSICU|nr:hypothetical protein JR316_0013160 [Psilocybe cubensis]KAH9474695.1 hypothetical protein JR316_0013160 [Psilocybe cubensis]
MDSTFIAAAGARGVERNGMVTGLEHSPYAVLAVAGARVYHTKLNVKDSQWIYSRWKGTLTFGRDVDDPNSVTQDISETERHWFRLADDETGRTVWMFKFPENFEYSVDRPFFHVFQGRTRTYGFLFNDDDEASVFGRKVMGRLSSGRGSFSLKARHIWANLLQTHVVEPVRKSRSPGKLSGSNRSKSLTGSISRSLISSPAPQSFKHIAHVGVNKDGLFEASKDLDSAWKIMLEDLQGHGVSDAIVVRQSNFVDGFWKEVEAIRMVEGSSVERFDLKDVSRNIATVTAL